MKKIKTPKDIQNLLLTDEQASVVRDTIVNIMQESFTNKGVSKEEVNKLFGDIPIKLAEDVVHNTQMTILQKAVYENAVEKSVKKIKKTKKKVVKTIKKIKKIK